MMSPLLKSATVSLRPVESTDLPLMYRLENDTTMWDTAASAHPLSRGTISRFISSATGDIYTDRQLRLVIESVDTGESVGFIDLTDFSPRHLRAEVGIALLPAFHHCGIGTEALRLAEQYAAQMLHIHQFYAYLSPANEASLRLFVSAGYQEVGTLHDWHRNPHGFEPIQLFQKIL